MKNQTSSNNQMASQNQNKGDLKTHFDEKNLIITYETFTSFGCIKDNDFKLRSPHFKMQVSEIQNVRDILNGSTKDRCVFVNGLTFEKFELDKNNYSYWGVTDASSKNTLYVISNKSQDSIFIVCDDYNKTNDSYDKFLRIGHRFIQDLEGMV